MYAIAKTGTGTGSGSHASIKLRELGSRVKKHCLSMKQDESESASQVEVGDMVDRGKGG